jgi:DNA polymerase III alpha subunit (gram-positive type)
MLRLLEQALVLVPIAVIIVTVGVIAWRRHKLGDDIRIVQSPSAPYLVNVNRAGKEELMLLPGIGEARAERIIAARKEGPFRSADEVRAASGLSEKQFQSVREFISLDGPAQ